MTDKLREEFETWLKKEHPTTYRLAYEDERQDGLVMNAKSSVLDMMIGWKASRAALVVELPNIVDDAWEDQRVGFNIGIKQCRSAIESKGVKVKS